MTRREAREQTFCILFEQALGGERVEEIFSAAEEARDLAPDPFTRREALGVEAHLEEIDRAIEKHLRGWSMRRLSKVTLALLRLAVYEILYESDIPVSVSINEAVELAKTYGGADDAPYLNGVLASVARREAEKQTADGEDAAPSA